MHDKKTPKALFGKIEKLCKQLETQQAAVATSVVKLAPKTWKDAPGTPVSEAAWETQSGPLNRATPMKPLGMTPIRKVILKLTPKPDEISVKIKMKAPKVLKKPEQDVEHVPVQCLSHSTAKLDVEQKLVKLEDDLSSGVDEASLIRQLTDLRSDFEQDSVAVNQWVLNRAKPLSDSATLSVKHHIIGLVFVHLPCASWLHEFNAVVNVIVEHLVEHVSLMLHYAQWISMFLDRVAFDEALAMKLASALVKSLGTTNPSDKLKSVRLIASLASSFPEAKEFFLAEFLSSAEKDENVYPSGIGLCAIFQSEILKKGVEIDETSVKEMLLPVTEEICKRFNSMPTYGATTLARLISKLTGALCVPELPTAVYVSKLLCQFALMAITSDKFKLDPAGRILVFDALIDVATFLRTHERSGAPSSFSADYFYRLEIPMAEKNVILKTYSKLLDMAPSTESCHDFLAVHKRLISVGPLAPLANSLILVLVRFASDSNLQSKIKAMRGLCSVLARGDPFVTKEGFISFLTSKFDDCSVTIRDVSLEILSKCFSAEQLISLDLVDKISRRSQDSSSLIRKRVIRIYRDLLSYEMSMENQSGLISNLLLMAKDEDPSTSQLSCKTLKETWLSKVFSKSDDRHETVQFVALMIRIIRTLGAESDCIQTFIKSCLEDKNISGQLSQLCVMAVDFLFESLISSVEASNWDAVRFILNAIDIFVGQEHGFLSSHLRLLFELTKSDQMASTEFALKLMKLAIKGCDKSTLMQISGCEQHLTMLILKGSEPVVRNATELLCEYIALTGDASGLLESLWRRFDGFLEGKRRDIVAGPLTSPVCRAIFTIGCLIKSFLHLDPDSTAPLEKTLPLLSIYFEKDNPTVSFYATQSVGLLIAENPKLALRPEVSGMFSAAIRSGRSDLSLVVLRSLIALVERKTATHLVSFDSSMKPAEDNITATIIQAYVNDIVGIAYSNNKDCQLLPLKILSYALMNGLCHPLQVIPTIVALSTSPLEDIRHRATQVFASLVETHSSFLFSNYTNVLTALFKLHSKFPDSRGFMDEVSGHESLLGPLYAELRSKKSKRHDLISTILQEYDDVTGNGQIEYGCFLLELAAMLPLKTLEEAVFLFSRSNELAVNYAAAYLEVDREPDTEEFIRAGAMLILRNYVMVVYSLTPEKCEKSLGNDNVGKSSIVAKFEEPISLTDLLGTEMTSDAQLSLIQSLLDEHLGSSPPNDEGKTVPRTKSKPRKKRRKYYECSDEDINSGASAGEFS